MGPIRRDMNAIRRIAFVAIAIFALVPLAHGQCVSLTTLGSAYTQNFDTPGLANTGTSSTVPAGWVFSESGTNANNVYTDGAGNSNGGAGDVPGEVSSSQVQTAIPSTRPARAIATPAIPTASA